MARSSDPLPPGVVARRPWYAGKPAVLFTAAITGLICVGAVVAAVTGSQGRAGMVVLALFTGSVSLMMLLSLRSGTDAWARDTLDGQPAWRLRLGAGSAAAVALVLTATAIGLVAGAVAARDSGGGVVVLGVLALGVLLLTVQMWQVVLRAPSVVVGVDRIVHDGAGVHVELAWDDVATIDLAHSGTRWSAVRIDARAGAASFRAEPRRSILRLDRVPDPPGIELRVGLLPDAPRMMRLLRDLQIGGRPTRESTLARGLPRDAGY